jgi:glutamyl-tRNA reductase
MGDKDDVQEAYRMQIQMAGIDYTKADMQQREAFAFTAYSLDAALAWLVRAYPHLGCVIIATCNRTELYLSGRTPEDPGPDRVLWALKDPALSACSGEVPPNLLVCRYGMDVVEHLFLLSSGLKSLIFGEHQILAQVKGALDAAQKVKSTDPALERLFQMAIGCAKRIKTETNINRADVSIASVAVERIQAYSHEHHIPLSDLRCLVIGNGVIGRQTAKHLVNVGCPVTITLRQHHQQKDTVVPQGCMVIDYDHRYACIENYTVCISATTSPHYTLTFERLDPVWDARKRLFIDLAMPRDMEPALRNLEGLTLLDLDQLGEGVLETLENLEKNEKSDEEAIHAILHETMREFAHWYAFRDYLGSIAAIQQAASTDMVWRLNRHLADLGLDAASQDRLRNALSHASQMVVGKLLFGLRDTLDVSIWEPCFRALETIALQPAVKRKTERKTHEECNGIPEGIGEHL